MTPHHNLPHLESMAWAIDHNGIGAIPAATLRELGLEADRFGVPTAVTDVLVDPNAPLVVRNRAFGVVAAALTNRSEVTLTAVAHAA